MGGWNLQYGGVVVAGGGGEGMDLMEVLASASAEETVVVPVSALAEASDATSADILLVATLDVAGGGGISWQQAEDSGSTLRSVVGMSQVRRSPVSGLCDSGRLRCPGRRHVQTSRCEACSSPLLPRPTPLTHQTRNQAPT